MIKKMLLYSLIIFWCFFWIFLYNNPFHNLWQPLLLVIIPVYLFVCFVVKVFKKKHKEPLTISIFILLIITVFLESSVNYDTMRPRPYKKIIVDRIDAGQWRVLVLRKNGQFEEFSEDWLHLKLLGINFRESFGIGRYTENSHKTICIYYQKYKTDFSYQPLDNEEINKAIKANIRYGEK